MYLLDTNVLSALRRPERADPQVRAWAAKTPYERHFLSSITILEVELGALLMARRDAHQGAVLRCWIDEQVLPRFEGRIIPVDVTVAQRGARLHVPKTQGERDALIAATALVHGLTLVTRNVADFAPTGVPLFNPWGA